jgi:hypothetical protein
VVTLDPRLKVTLMLADAAQAVGGKLFILGGGWSFTGGMTPFAIAMDVKVPWDLANRRHKLRLELIDSDGRPVLVQQAPEADPEPLVLEPELEVGRPAGLTPGTPLDATIAVNFGPLGLQPGRYEWRLMVNGECQEDWALPFTVVPSQAPDQDLAA